MYESRLEGAHAAKNLFMKSVSNNNPIRHTQKIKAQMSELRDHLREDIRKVSEPKARALFETAAEVLNGLVKAFEDYEKKSEEAWRSGPMLSPHEEISSP